MICRVPIFFLDPTDGHVSNPIGPLWRTRRYSRNSSLFGLWKGQIHQWGRNRRKWRIILIRKVFNKRHPRKIFVRDTVFYKRYLFFFITKQTLHLNFQFRLILGLYVKKNPPVCLDANLEPSGVVCEKAYSFPFSSG